MNELVYDIALEVLKDYPTLDSWTFSRTELSQFAELIVKECTDVVGTLPCGYQDYRDQIEDAFRSYCISAINKHFGVEE